jgi:predicted metal-dependent hydrolase
MLRALFYRRPQTIEPIEIVHDDAKYLVRIKRYRQARRYTLRLVTATREVMLTMPPRGSLKEAKAFAEKNSAWIASRVRHLPETAPFRDGECVPLRGVMYRICHMPCARGTVWIEVIDGKSVVCVAGAAPHLHRRLTDFLRREARSDLESASRRYADALNVKIASISVRDQVSRWGSCSSAGALSFSWRLILAPAYVLDYLAAHEVAHLVEMNHSRKFWRTLLSLYPDTDRAKAWLDAHGSSLHRYGAQ